MKRRDFAQAVALGAVLTKYESGVQAEAGFREKENDNDGTETSD